MTVRYSKTFRKQFSKLQVNQQSRFWQQLELFIDNPRANTLHNHRLKGNYHGYRSIDVGGDLRALYKLLDDGSVVIFDLIGTHSQLYG